MLLPSGPSSRIRRHLHSARPLRRILRAAQAVAETTHTTGALCFNIRSRCSKWMMAKRQMENWIIGEEASHSTTTKRARGGTRCPEGGEWVGMLSAAPGWRRAGCRWRGSRRTAPAWHHTIATSRATCSGCQRDKRTASDRRREALTLTPTTSTCRAATASSRAHPPRQASWPRATEA